jgi:malate dehydrogenase (oxaloacetate-decarboxylating)(NADP+)
MALANPFPEIMPDEARIVRPDALICTGRSDFPNQVNNVLCFPYIFRGALDCGATAINEAMKHAAVEAIAALARETPSDIAARAYGGEARRFGPESLIPSPFDPRLILRIAPAVAGAAMKSGVATRPIADLSAYAESLTRFVFRSGFIMKPIFAAAREAPKRVVYSEGEDERVLRAAQVVLEEGLARPILIGRPAVIQARLERFGLTIRPGQDVDIIDPADDPRYKEYWTLYHALTGRHGVTPDAARTIVRSNATVIGALALRRGDGDALVCGLEGGFMRHLRDVRHIIGLAPGICEFSALSLVITSKGVFFICDTQVKPDPTAEEVAEMAILAAEHVKRFGLEPKIALLSHADFGSYDTASAGKMREALAILTKKRPDLEADGEMQADTALSEAVRELKLQGSRLNGEANVLVMPNLDAANIAYQITRMLADALPVGPILIGGARPAHILTRSATVRGIVNMTAVAVVEAGQAAT